jgi:putative protease
MKKPELLAPGGSFLSAYYAFQAGADGVYLGMKEFSARKAAANFTPEQLRRLLGVARERGGRVYLALNTVVREEELPRAAETLFWAETLGLDGVIVQDLGVVELARRHFPALPLHASTQMAVHNSQGLAAAREMGLRRVILARELDFAAIRALREQNPDIELEVFIHGALCYSFSGLCLASWALTGRSGNRGDCAQVCRSLFRSQDGEGFFFSCRDLYLGPEVLRLAEIGIDALKIEGRMKSPEYVFHTVKLYREILDRAGELPPAELAELERRSALGFARKRTPGYFHDLRGERLLETRHPGHRLEADLSLRDGLQFFPAGDGGPVQFSVRGLRRDGREVSFARKGEEVEVDLPPEARPPQGRPPEVGQELFQLSSRFLDLPQPREGGFRPYRVPCSGTIELEGAAGGQAALRARVPALGFAWETRVRLEQATLRRSFAAVLQEVFQESGESLFRVEQVELRNRTGLADDRVFVPPSALKRARAAFYLALAQAFEQRRRDRLRQVEEDRETPEGAAAAGLAPAAASAQLCTPELLRLAARRQDLAPRARHGGQLRAGSGGGFGPPHPFAERGEGPAPEPAELAEVGGLRFLPLAPVDRSGDQAEWVLRLIAANPQTRFAIGLSNLAHLQLAQQLQERENVFFFADFHLYVANRFAASFLARRVPRLLFAMHWLEGPREHADALSSAVSLPLVRLDSSFRPPLFYGMGCPRGQGTLRVGGRGGCRDCPGGFEADLSQGRSRFLLRVRGCTAYLYAAPRRGGSAREAVPSEAS